MKLDVMTKTASQRYLNDAEFHHEVDRAVMSAMSDAHFFDEIDEKLAREAATRAVVLALHLRDSPGEIDD